MQTKDWEDRIRKVKQVLWSRVHPSQEFRQIIVSEDFALNIKDAVGANINDPSLGCVFEGIPIKTDDRLPEGSVVFIPSDPT